MSSGILQRYTPLMCFFVAVTVCISLLSLPAHALDQASLTLSPSVANGDIRNIASLSVAPATGSASALSIRVRNHDGTPLIVEGHAVGADDPTGKAAPLLLNWNTASVPDAEYTIDYSGKDATSGHNVTQFAYIRVRNAQPLVTVATSLAGRSVSGTVSRSDVSFRTRIDGEQVDVQPVIASIASSDQSFAWSLVVPDSVADGRHAIEVYATPLSNGVESDVAMQQVTVTTVQLGQPPAPPIQSLPVLPLVQEIGQFIAPIIQSVTMPIQSTFFGVPVTDITSTQQPAQPIAPKNPGVLLNAANVRESVPDFGTPLQQSNSGWKVAGIAWYWWLICAGVLLAAVYAIIKRRAKSVIATQYSQVLN